MRLKVEFIILNSEAALIEAEELSVMLRKEAEKEQKDSEVKVKKEKKLSKKVSLLFPFLTPLILGPD